MPVGEDNAKACLTEAKVRELRRLVHDKGLCRACAHRLLAPEVRYITAVKAINFITWRHVR